MDPRVVIRNLKVEKDQKAPSLDGRFDGSTGFLMKTSTSGIPARVDDKAGHDDASLCFVKNNGDIKVTAAKFRVFNPFSEPIGSETYITVKVINGTQLVVDAEDCQ